VLHRHLISLALACALAGCVSTAYKRPPVTVPDAWREPNAQNALWPSQDWWKGFNSSRLNELIDAAVRANDDLAAAVARVREADAQVRIAGAPLWPSLDLSAEATRERAKPTGSTTQRRVNTFSPQIGAQFR